MKKLFILTSLTFSVAAFAAPSSEGTENEINSGLYNIDFRAGNGKIYCGGDAKTSDLARYIMSD